MRPSGSSETQSLRPRKIILVAARTDCCDTCQELQWLCQFDFTLLSAFQEGHLLIRWDIKECARLPDKPARRPDALHGSRDHKPDWLAQQSGQAQPRRPAPTNPLEISLGKVKVKAQPRRPAPTNPLEIFLGNFLLELDSKAPNVRSLESWKVS